MRLRPQIELAVAYAKLGYKVAIEVETTLDRNRCRQIIQRRYPKFKELIRGSTKASARSRMRQRHYSKNWDLWDAQGSD